LIVVTGTDAKGRTTYRCPDPEKLRRYIEEHHPEEPSDG
jgi:hypothetical protein